MKKRCKICGAEIGGEWDRSYYSEIALQYCPDCAIMQRQHAGRIRSKQYRERKKENEREKERRLKMLEAENRELRDQLAVLRKYIGR